MCGRVGAEGVRASVGEGSFIPNSNEGRRQTLLESTKAEESFVTNFIPTSDHIKTHNSSTNFALTEKCQRTVAAERVQLVIC